MNEKPRLLIVEDDSENQKVLRALLKRNFDIDICDSETTFYECLSAKEYDIILMDISLRGDKDGLELTTEVRQNPQYSKLPIVALTAHAFQKDKDNAYKSGVDFFLTKPVQSKYLLESLNMVLEKQQEK